MALDLDTNKFKFIGGDISLDFVNTVSGRSGKADKNNTRDYQNLPGTEKINDYADLLKWSVKAKLVGETAAHLLLQTAEKEPQAAEKVLRRARDLRESVYRLFKSAIEGCEPEAEDLEKFNKELAAAWRHQILTWTEGDYHFQWIDAENALNSMLWQIAESAAAMLVTGDLSRVRQCGGDDCGWLFLDTSRNRRRQWCDMKDCGNLAKIRRFRLKNSSI